MQERECVREIESVREAGWRSIQTTRLIQRLVNNTFKNVNVQVQGDLMPLCLVKVI